MNLVSSRYSENLSHTHTPGIPAQTLAHLQTPAHTSAHPQKTPARTRTHPCTVRGICDIFIMCNMLKAKFKHTHAHALTPIHTHHLCTPICVICDMLKKMTEEERKKEERRKK